MGESGFYRFGRMLGGKFRTARWVWSSLAGSEAEAIRAEYAVGREMAAVVRAQAGQPDPQVQQLLDDLAGPLSRAVRNELHRFSIAAVPNEAPTAFALPGGFIFVGQGLIELCRADRNELAFVVGHEMAHVVRRHAINRLVTHTALSAATLASPARGWVAPFLRRVGRQWLEGAYSREHELEADALGLLLARAGGFDPSGATRLLARLRVLERQPGGLGLAGYFATHPPLDERIAHLQRRLETGDWS